MASHRTRRGVLSLLVAAAIAAAAQPALGGNVLVAGTGVETPTIQTHLENAGHSVTLFQSDTLPASLAAYSTVWVHTLSSLAAPELAKLEAFVESGGGVYINGEWGTCCSGAGSSANGEALVNLTVAGAGSISIGDGFSSVSGNGTPNPSAVGGITQTPYAPSHMEVAAAGRITGAAAANQVITSAGSVVAAAWSDAQMVSGAGRIVVVMDSNWIDMDPWVDEWVANLQHFLESPDTDGDGIPDSADSCTDTDGDGFGDPGYAANTCALDACPTVAGVSPDGCAVAVPALSVGGRVLLGLILVALASPPLRTVIRRIGIGPFARR